MLVNLMPVPGLKVLPKLHKEVKPEEDPKTRPVDGVACCMR